MVTMETAHFLNSKCEQACQNWGVAHVLRQNIQESSNGVSVPLQLGCFVRFVLTILEINKLYVLECRNM